MTPQTREKPVHGTTASGRIIDIRKPDPAHILIDEIADGLGRICRYAGAITRPHYSVAEHSTIVAACVFGSTRNPHAALRALLHDAHEYVLGDVCWVLESNLSASARGEIAKLRYTLDEAISRAVGLAWPSPLSEVAIIITAHNRVDATEFNQGITRARPEGAREAYPHRIECLNWERSSQRFAKAFNLYAALANLPLRARE